MLFNIPPDCLPGEGAFSQLHAGFSFCRWHAIFRSLVNHYEVDMAVTRPRFSITVSEELNAALLDLAETTNGARASIAAEFLEECLPAIIQVAKAVKMAKKDAPAALDLLNESLLQATQVAAQLGLEINEERRKIRQTSGQMAKRSKKAKSA